MASCRLSLFKSAATVGSTRSRFLSGRGVFSHVRPLVLFVSVVCALCFFYAHIPRLSCNPLCRCDRTTRGSLASASSPVSSMPMARASSPRYVRPPLVFGGRSSRVFVCPVMTDLFCSPWCTSRLRDRLQVKWPPRVCVQLVLGSSGSGSGVSGTSVGRVLPQFGSRQKRLHGCV